MVDNKFPLTLEFEKDSWQLVLDSEAERTMWAIHFQHAILKMQPSTTRSLQLYSNFHKIEKAAVQLREVLAINDKSYEGEGKTFVRPSDVSRAQEAMASVVSNLDQLERLYGPGSPGDAPHWESILAPYVNLVPRAGMAMSSLQVKLMVHDRIDAYHRERSMTMGLLKCGKLQLARQHWKTGTTDVNALLTDNMFRISSKKGANKSFRSSQGDKSTSRRNSDETDNTIEDPELALLPEIRVFKKEFEVHEKEIEEMIEAAVARETHWRWFSLSERITQALSALDRTMATAAIPYYPPYSEAPWLTTAKVDTTLLQCEHVRARLDSFIRTQQEQSEKEKEWTDKFMGNAATKWKQAKDNVVIMQKLAQQYKQFHRFGSIASGVPALALAGEVGAAELAWAEAKQIAVVLIGGTEEMTQTAEGKNEASMLQGLLVNALRAFKEFYELTAHRLEQLTQYAEEEQQRELASHQPAADESSISAQGEPDPFSPEACIRKAEWYHRHSHVHTRKHVKLSASSLTECNF